MFDLHPIIYASVIDWIIRIWAVFVVPKNRKPSSATAWLMVILFFPFVGLLVFVLLGSPKLNKKRRKMQKRIDKKIYEGIYNSNSGSQYRKHIPSKIDDRIKPFVSLNKNLGGFPVFKGSSASLIDVYDDAITSIAKDIDMSKKFVHIEYFIIVMDDSTEVLFKSMEEAVNRGVRVRLMFDAIGNRGYPNMKKMLARLDKIGVEWHKMLPLKLPGKEFNRPDLRNHRKIVVIDGHIGYTGSQNLVTRNYHRKDDLYYDELIVRLTGPIVVQLEVTFVSDWFTETNQTLVEKTHPELAVKIKSTGDMLSQILPSGPGFENDNNLKLFTALIHSANGKLLIVNPYFVPEDSLITAITSAAQRGVKVTMINSKIMDQAMVGHAQRSYFEQLLESGVKIFQYDLPILLHSKFMVIDDDISVIGSSNLDMRSFQLDLEVTLVAYDKNISKSLQKISEKYLKRSQVVVLTKWKKRSLKTKLFENLARLTAAVQ